MLDVGVEVFPGFLEIGNGLVKMPAVIPGFHEGEQGTQGLGHVPDDPEVDAGPPAEVLAPDVELDDARFLGIPRGIGHVRAEQDKQIAVFHRLIRAAESDEAGHAHVEGIVRLDPLLAAPCVPDGGLELVREGHDFLAGVAASGPAIKRHLARAVDFVGKELDVMGVGCRGGRRRYDARARVLRSWAWRRRRRAGRSRLPRVCSRRSAWPGAAHAASGKARK